MRLALGTAQFGQHYGIANQHGRIPRDEARAIIAHAKVSGVETLDTAIAYGDSERELGQIGVAGWQVISKLPAMPVGCADVSRWTAESFHESLSRLKLTGLYGLLLHRPQQLLERDGDRLYGALQQLKRQGLVQKIGISIYDPAELDDLCHRFAFDLIQAPFNLIDRRLINSGWMTRLKQKGIELHVRSVFLQGLLLMSPRTRPKKFDRWASLWVKYDEWLKQTGQDPLQACLRDALSFTEVNKVVVGVDHLKQLKETIQAAIGPVPMIPDGLAMDDPELINPGRWTELA